MADRRSRPAGRAMAVTALSLLVAAALLWAASRQTWDPGPGDAAEAADADAARALGGLAMLALAGAAGLLAFGGWIRRVAGVVVALAGVAGVVVAVIAADGPGEPWLGRALAGAGGLLLIFGGVVMAWYAGRVGTIGAKYRRGEPAGQSVDPDQKLWNELSEGRDPTVD